MVARTGGRTRISERLMNYEGSVYEWDCRLVMQELRKWCNKRHSGSLQCSSQKLKPENINYRI